MAGDRAQNKLNQGPALLKLPFWPRPFRDFEKTDTTGPPSTLLCPSPEVRTLA